MKSLIECKAYFKDAHQDYLQNGSYRDHSVERYRMMNELLRFIYPEFELVKWNWISESLDELYGQEDER